jgi:hypothetical protein
MTKLTEHLAALLLHLSRRFPRRFLKRKSVRIYSSFHYIYLSNHSNTFHLSNIIRDKKTCHNVLRYKKWVMTKCNNRRQEVRIQDIFGSPLTVREIIRINRRLLKIKLKKRNYGRRSGSKYQFISIYMNEVQSTRSLSGDKVTYSSLYNLFRPHVLQSTASSGLFPLNRLIIIKVFISNL